VTQDWDGSGEQAAIDLTCRTRLAPGKAAYCLFPFFMFVHRAIRSPADLIFVMQHEHAHLASLRLDGYWGFYCRMDLLAKILLEIVFEQGGDDPHRLLDVALGVWAKLHLLDDAGQLLEEALALAYLFEAGWEEDAWRWAEALSHQRMSTQWFSGRRWKELRKQSLLATFEERKAGLLKSPSVHGEAARLLEELTAFASVMSPGRRLKGRNHLLLGAGALAIDELSFLEMSYSHLRERIERPPYELNRNARLRELVASPAECTRRWIKTGTPEFFFEEHEPAALVLHLGIPREYHSVVSDRFVAYLSDHEEEPEDVVDMFKFDSVLAPKPMEELDYLMFITAPMSFGLTPQFASTHGSLAYLCLVTMTYVCPELSLEDTEEAAEERLQLLQWLEYFAVGRTEWDTKLAEFTIHSATRLVHAPHAMLCEQRNEPDSMKKFHKAAAWRLERMQALHQKVESPPIICSIRENFLRRSLS